MTQEYDDRYTHVRRKLLFHLTSWACPEQYDVVKGKHTVGYVRLRGGRFRVDVPRCGGVTVLVHEFPDDVLGRFETDAARDEWLDKAADAVWEHRRLWPE